MLSFVANATEYNVGVSRPMGKVLGLFENGFDAIKKPIVFLFCMEIGHSPDGDISD